MPPRRFKKKSVKRIVEKHVAKAIEEYEKTRVDSNNTGGSGSANTRGIVAPDVHGCSYKTFMNGKPHSFSGTEGVVGLKRCFESHPLEQRKAMMTTESAQQLNPKMEQELWTLTLKGDDIEAYNNRFPRTAPAKGRGYAGNLPWCNRCKAHHQPGPCLLGVVNVQAWSHTRKGSVELDPVANTISLQK
ncbi:hypothetical protein Tco_0958743 [Tanacetum coccineum]